MGELLETFTFPRNAFAKSDLESSRKAMETLERARAGVLKRASNDSGRIKDEPFNDSRSFLGTVGGDPDSPKVLPVGERFEEFYSRDPVEAWQWLLTRSMWLFSLPNHTNTRASSVAKAQGLRFNFFDLILRTLHHLQIVPDGETLYFEELLPILNDDSAWLGGPLALAPAVLAGRAGDGTPSSKSSRGLLEDLETEYGIQRDNFAGMFGKAFGQCGLFQLVESQRVQVGIRLSPQVFESRRLMHRYKFVLDNPRYPPETV